MVDMQPQIVPQGLDGLVDPRNGVVVRVRLRLNEYLAVDKARKEAERKIKSMRRR